MTNPGDANPAPDPMAGRPSVSVIIPHLNTPDALRRCLISVTGQQLASGHAEIIVVDNGSAVSPAPVIAEFPGISLLLEPTPGPGPARNRGVAAASAATLAFIDADCRAAPGWLQAAVTAVAADPLHAIVGGDIRIDFVDPATLTGIEAYEAVFGFRQHQYIAKKHFSVTANLAMAAAVHARVGGFAGIDRAEDLDWGQRAHAAGLTTRYDPRMLVLHPARPKFSALASKWQRHIRHDWNAHHAKGSSDWRWHLRAAALVASIPVESLKLLTSNRISGLANRLRGIAILARIRCYRAAEMRRVMASPAATGAMTWNRQP